MKLSKLSAKSAFVFLLLLNLQSCGDDFQQEGKIPKAIVTDPSRANISDWSKAWDGQSWILGLRTRKITEQSLLRQFQGSLSTEWSLLSQRSTQAMSRVSGSWEISLSLSPVALNRCVNAFCPSFAFVKFAQKNLPWEQSFGLSFLEKSDLTHEFTAGRFGFLQNIFQKMPDIAYAEPDLKSPLNSLSHVLGQDLSKTKSKTTATITPQQNPDLALAPTDDAGAPEASQPTTEPAAAVKTYLEHIRNIKIIDAEKERTKKNLAAREIVVAVLDTGVDSANDYLKDRMFRFPDQAGDTKPAVRNVGGGSYLADAYGIDASWNSKTSPAIQALSPGSADIGGPGIACPEKSKSLVGTACGHGTHVAGLVAGSEFASGVNNGETGRGVCDSCKILAVRVVDTVPTEPPNNGSIPDSNQIRGVQFVLGLKRSNGTLYTNVVNMSIGQYTSTRAMRSVIDALDQNGIIIVAAASNQNTDRPSYPAAYEPVISVCATSTAAVGGRGRYVKAAFSNFGTWVKICAPGQAIESTIPGPSLLAPLDGTSMAAPIVAGAAGFLVSIADAIKVGELNRNEKVRNSLLVRSNWSALYAEEANLPYQFVLPDGSGVEFLGRGFLDVANAFLGTRDIDKERKSAPSDQISGGCVVSSVAFRGKQDSEKSLGLLLESFPFLLGVLVSFLRLSRHCAHLLNCKRQDS